VATEIQVRANFKPLIDANKQAAELKKTLGEIDQTEIGVKVTGLDKFHQYNQTVQQSIDEYVQDRERKSTWQDRYKMTEKPVNSNEIDQWDQQRTGGSNNSNWWAWGKRGLAVGAALLGVKSVLGMAQEAKNEAIQFSSANADLYLRGGSEISQERALRWAKNFGVKPAEQMDITNLVSSATGANDFQNTGYDVNGKPVGGTLSRVAKDAMGYGTVYGIGGQAVAQYIGRTFPAVEDFSPIYDKNGPVEGGKVFKSLGRIADSLASMGQGGRLHEVLELNAKMLTDIVGRRGGKELSFGERDQLTMLQMGLWALPGQMGKGASGLNMFETMDRGIRSGGDSRGMQTLIAQARFVELPIASGRRGFSPECCFRYG
jgi:hypothetical protein